MASQPASSKSSRDACHGGRRLDPADNTHDTPGPRRNDDSHLISPPYYRGVYTQAGGRANLLIIGS